MEDNFIHSQQCEDQDAYKPCICDELYFAKLDEAANAAVDEAREADLI